MPKMLCTRTLRKINRCVQSSGNGVLHGAQVLEAASVENTKIFYGIVSSLV